MILRERNTAFFDLCVVGAGPAGIAIARALEASGLHICLIEAGSARLDEPVGRAGRGESDGYPIHPLDRSRSQGFGGTLRHPGLGDDGWAARPLDPIDFEARPAVPGSGWPIGPTELAPYYARAHPLSGLLPLPDYRPDGADDAIPDPLTGDPDLERSLFQFGQPDFSTDLQQLANNPRVELMLHSRVVELVPDTERRRVDHVQVRRDDGHTTVVHARRFVLAAGGIENARLLLCADGFRGLGNEHDLVGRYFAERISLHAGHVDGLEALDRADRHYALHPVGAGSVRSVLRVTDRAQREHGLLNCAFFPLPRTALVTSDAARSLAVLHTGLERRPRPPGLGRHVARIVQGTPHAVSLALTARHRRTVVLWAQAEQSPHPDSRVTLGDRRDDLGIPVARVTWRMRDSDLDSVRMSLAKLAPAFPGGTLVNALGPDGPPFLVKGNHHHMGTTRMDRDPARGVVDRDCRVHSLANVHVAGSAVFPTYGCSNPTLTILALALRLADHLREALDDGPSSSAVPRSTRTEERT